MDKIVEASQKISRIFGLDLMRAMAILMVLFGHCTWIFPETKSIVYQLMVLSGFFGVEIFFVLSGFLIGKILYQLYLKDDFSINTVFYFLKRRWFRTLPNYFLVLLLNVGIASIIGYNIGALWKYFFFLQNFNASMLPFFPESWSLSVEEYAYLVFPFFILLLGIVIKPINKPRFFLLSIVLLIIIFFCNKVYYQMTTVNTNLVQWNLSLKSVVCYRLDSIFIGVLCSWIYINFSSYWRKNKYVFFVLGTVILFFQFVVIGNLGLFIESHPVVWNVFYLSLVSLGVACFLPFLSEWKTEKSFFQKPVVFISVISYSIYLLHYGIILQLMKHFIVYDPKSRAMLYGFTGVYVFITFLLSYLLYRFYEKPMMDLRGND